MLQQFLVELHQWQHQSKNEIGETENLPPKSVHQPRCHKNFLTLITKGN